jgi:hypothetical protein|tara:strand:+ start:793 stop:1227 length:435 start_codon:yes stop_codon:yes gene_type:complete
MIYIKYDRVNSKEISRNSYDNPKRTLDKKVVLLPLTLEVQPTFNPRTEELNKTITVPDLSNLSIDVPENTTYTEGWAKSTLSAEAQQQLIDIEISNTDGLLVYYLEDLIVAIAEAKTFDKLVIPAEILKVVNRRRNLRGLPDVA